MLNWIIHYIRLTTVLIVALDVLFTSDCPSNSSVHAAISSMSNPLNYSEAQIVTDSDKQTLAELEG